MSTERATEDHFNEDGASLREEQEQEVKLPEQQQQQQQEEDAGAEEEEDIGEQPVYALHRDEDDDAPDEEEDDEEQDELQMFNFDRRHDDDDDEDVDNEEHSEEQQTSSSQNQKQQQQAEDVAVDAQPLQKNQDDQEQQEEKNASQSQNEEGGASASNLDLEVFFDTVTNAFQTLGSYELTQDQLVEFVQKNYKKSEESAPSSISKTEIVNGIKSLFWDGLIYATNEDEDTFAMTSVNSVLKATTTDDSSRSLPVAEDANNNAGSSAHQNESENNTETPRDALAIGYRPPSSYNELQWVIYGLVLKNLTDQFNDNGRVSLPRDALIEKIYHQLFGAPEATFTLDVSLPSFRDRGLNDADIRSRERISQIFDELEADLHICKIVTLAAPRSAFGAGTANYYRLISGPTHVHRSSDLEKNAMVAKSKGDNILAELTVNSWRHGISDFSCDGRHRRTSAHLLSLIPMELRSRSFVTFRKVQEFYFELQKALDPSAVDPGMVLRLTETDWTGKKKISSPSDQKAEDEVPVAAAAPLAPSTSDVKRLIKLHDDLIEISNRGKKLLQEKEMTGHLKKRGWSLREYDHLAQYLRYERKITEYESSFGSTHFIRVNGGQKSNKTFPAYVNKPLYDEYSSPAGIAFSVDLRRVLTNDSALGLTDVFRCLSYLGWKNGRVCEDLLKESARRHMAYRADDRLSKENQSQSTWLATSRQGRNRIEYLLRFDRRLISLFGGDAAPVVQQQQQPQPYHAPPPSSYLHPTSSSSVPSVSSASASVARQHQHQQQHAVPAGFLNPASSSVPPPPPPQLQHQQNINYDPFAALLTGGAAFPTTAGALRPQPSSSTDAAPAGVRIDPVAALTAYLADRAKRMNSTTRKFWNDLCRLLPSNGDPVRKSVVFQTLGEQCGWNDKAERNALIQTLEDNFFIGACRSSRRTDNADMYRIIPKIFRQQPPKGIERLSPKVTETSFMPYVLKYNLIPSSVVVQQPQATTSHAAAPQQQHFIVASLTTHPVAPPPPQIAIINHHYQDAPPPPPSVFQQQQQQQQQPQQQRAFDWRSLKAEELLPKILSTAQLKFHQNVDSIIPRRGAATKANILSLLNKKFKWTDKIERDSLFQELLDLGIIQEGQHRNLKNTTVVERNPVKKYQIPQRLIDRAFPPQQPSYAIPSTSVPLPPPAPQQQQFVQYQQIMPQSEWSQVPMMMMMPQQQQQQQYVAVVPPPPPTHAAPQLHAYHHVAPAAAAPALPPQQQPSSSSSAAGYIPPRNPLRMSTKERWAVISRCPNTSSLNEKEQKFLFEALVVFELDPDGRTKDLPLERREITKRELYSETSKHGFPDRENRERTYDSLVKNRILLDCYRPSKDDPRNRNAHCIKFHPQFSTQLTDALYGGTSRRNADLNSESGRRQRSRSPPQQQQQQQPVVSQPPPGFFAPYVPPPPPPPPPQQNDDFDYHHSSPSSVHHHQQQRVVPPPPPLSSSSSSKNNNTSNSKFQPPPGFFGGTVPIENNHHQQHHNPPPPPPPPPPSQQAGGAQIFYDASGNPVVVYATPPPQPSAGRPLDYNSDQNNDRGSSGRNGGGIQMIFLFPSTPISVPPPLMIRDGIVIRRQVSSRLLVAPPPFYPRPQQ